MNTSPTDQLSFERAKQRVKKIKGFYTHLLIYTVVNLIIVYVNIQNLEPGESYFQFHNFISLTLWGIAIIMHGLTAFLPNFILGSNWEERKIEKYMNEEKDRKRWE